MESVLLVPEMKDLVSLALKLCWAYGESIMDLRALLQGGKIPLVKDRDSWQLSLGSLTDNPSLLHNHDLIRNIIYI